MNTTGIALQLARMNRALSRLVEELVQEHVRNEGPGDSLPPVQAAILEALQDGRPQPGKRVARSSGYAYGGRLRRVLADMVRAGFLTHGPNGYALPKPAAPNQQPVRSLPNRLNGHAVELDK